MVFHFSLGAILYIPGFYEYSRFKIPFPCYENAMAQGVTASDIKNPENNGEKKHRHFGKHHGLSQPRHRQALYCIARRQGIIECYHIPYTGRKSNRSRIDRHPCRKYVGRRLFCRNPTPKR